MKHGMRQNIVCVSRNRYRVLSVESVSTIPTSSDRSAIPERDFGWPAQNCRSNWVMASSILGISTYCSRLGPVFARGATPPFDMVSHGLRRIALALALELGIVVFAD